MYKYSHVPYENMYPPPVLSFSTPDLFQVLKGWGVWCPRNPLTPQVFLNKTYLIYYYNLHHASCTFTRLHNDEAIFHSHMHMHATRSSRHIHMWNATSHLHFTFLFYFIFVLIHQHRRTNEEYDDVGFSHILFKMSYFILNLFYFKFVFLWRAQDGRLF